MKSKLCMVIIACIAVATASNALARELSVKEKKLIEKVAKEQLKDPDSAKFYWQDYKGGNIYCAHINAKNAYGGYSGKSLMTLGVKKNNAGEIIFAEGIIHDSDSAAISSPICTDAGYKP